MDMDLADNLVSKINTHLGEIPLHGHEMAEALGIEYNTFYKVYAQGMCEALHICIVHLNKILKDEAKH